MEKESVMLHGHPHGIPKVWGKVVLFQDFEPSAGKTGCGEITRTFMVQKGRGDDLQSSAKAAGLSFL
ncbi:MAG: hypothetical protein QF579_01905 [Dehalococcoidia bacterium]|jgi:hypothetical protein|nr:hypothetical protein [Dehalococcoidia bacterium]